MFEIAGAAASSFGGVLTLICMNVIFIFSPSVSCTLSESRISEIGDEEEVNQEMGHLQYLDLKSNLLSNWHEIAILSRALPNLQVLLLGGNRLGPAPMSLADDIMAIHFGRNGFSQLLSLELSGVRLSSWSQVSSVLFLL